MAGCGCLTGGGGGTVRGVPGLWPGGPSGALGRDGTPRRSPVLRTRSAGRHPGGAVTGPAACPARPATVHTLTDQRGGNMPVTLVWVPGRRAADLQGREQEL